MEYGKFNSAEELLKGYTELEKGFTQKCQQLAELRNKYEIQNTPETGASSNRGEVNGRGTNGIPSPQNGGEEGASAEVKEACAVPADNGASSAASSEPAPQSAIEQIRQYLTAHPEERDLLLNRPNAQITALPRVIAGGGNVSMAPPSRPKTIKEASLMAKELFKN